MLRQKFIIAMILCLSITALDQFSKLYLLNFLPTKPNYVLPINSYFELVYSWNYGISFGLFSQYDQYSNIIFLCLNIVIISYLIYLIYSSIKEATLTSTTASVYFLSGLILITGGALGNWVDRVWHGAVFDFIHLHYYQYSFPAFNIADTAISIGATLFILNSLTSFKASENQSH